MALWLLGYIIMGQVALPVALSLLGVDQVRFCVEGVGGCTLRARCSQHRGCAAGCTGEAARHVHQQLARAAHCASGGAPPTPNAPRPR